MAGSKKVSSGKKTVSRKKSTPSKPALKKKARSPKQKKPDLFSELKKVVIGIAVLLAVCLTSAMLVDIFIRPDPVIDRPQKSPHKKMRGDKQKTAGPVKDKPPQTREEPADEDSGGAEIIRKVAGLKKKSGTKILYEVFEELDPTHARKPPSVKGTRGDVPKISIIIDDIGYDRHLAMALFDLESNITFSVLPGSPFGRSISEQLNRRGAEIMLHLPMEPMEYPKVNPGPGALLSSMAPDVLLEQLRINLAEVAGVSGVNNHMGSRLTTRAAQMNQIFTILKKRDLFFIDSRTSVESRARASARLLRVRFAQRDIFLDNFQDSAYISKQFRQLVRLAEKHGAAIGIGHPYAATLKTLKKEVPKLRGKIQVVPVSKMAFIPG